MYILSVHSFCLIGVKKINVVSAAYFRQHETPVLPLFCFYFTTSTSYFVFLHAHNITMLPPSDDTTQHS